MAFLSETALRKIGFRSIGHHVCLSDRASIHNPGAISLGDHSRVDDFALLSAGDGGIVVGAHVHIAPYSSLIGRAEIRLDDFVGLSSRVSIYSSSDDYSGAALTNPTVPEQYSRVSHARVHLCRHVIVGAGCVILPGVVVREGAAVGALSLVTRDCEPFFIYGGVPAVKLKPRKRDLLVAEAALRSETTPSH